MNMKLIKLGGIYGLGKFAKVDDEDYQKVKSRKWFLSSYRNGTQYVRCRIGKDSDVRLHRFIIQAKKGQLVDHINHDTLDNRKGNLRFCTNRENQQNCRTHVDKMFVDGALVPKGVKFDKTRPHHPWVARILFKGKRIETKGFVTREEAGQAYRELSKKYFGEFASY